MNAKHTEGPWAISRVSDTTVIAANGSSVASCGGHSDNSRDSRELHEEQKANARLIASAPDLLAALQDLISWIPGREAWHTEAPMVAANKARAAIAKATGAA